MNIIKFLPLLGFLFLGLTACGGGSGDSGGGGNVVAPPVNQSPTVDFILPATIASGQSDVFTLTANDAEDGSLTPTAPSCTPTDLLSFADGNVTATTVSSDTDVTCEVSTTDSGNQQATATASTQVLAPVLAAGDFVVPDLTGGEWEKRLGDNGATCGPFGFEAGEVAYFRATNPWGEEANQCIFEHTMTDTKGDVYKMLINMSVDPDGDGSFLVDDFEIYFPGEGVIIAEGSCLIFVSQANKLPLGSAGTGDPTGEVCLVDGDATFQTNLGCFVINRNHRVNGVAVTDQKIFCDETPDNTESVFTQVNSVRQ